MSEPILTQEEIDALLSAIQEGTVELGDGAEPEAEVEPFDFTKQYRLAQKMPTLDLLHRRLGTQLKGVISGMIGRSVEVQVRPSRTVVYGKYLSTIPPIASFSLVALDPLVGYGMVVLHPGMLSLFIDLLLGNRTLRAPTRRETDLTAVELRFAQRIVETLMVPYREAWEAVHPLRLPYVRTEQASLFTPIVPNEEPVVVVQIEVEIAEVTESLALVLPDASLEVIREKLVRDFRITDPKASKSFGEMIANQLLGIDVEIDVELGRMDLQVVDLLNLEVGDVLTLSQRVDSPLTVFVEGVPKLQGTTGSSLGSMALEVTGRLSKE